MAKIVKLDSIYSLSPKERKNAIKKEKRNGLKRALIYFSDKLNNKNIKSEVWFQEYYKHFQDVCDVYNDPIDRYIVDILNRKYMYAIEIDGSWHDRPDAKVKDKKKEARLKSLGYRVIRVKHNDLNGLKSAIIKILQLRGIQVLKTKIVKDGELLLELDFETQEVINIPKSKPDKDKHPLTNTKSNKNSKPVVILRKKN